MLFGKKRFYRSCNYFFFVETICREASQLYLNGIRIEKVLRNQLHIFVVLMNWPIVVIYLWMFILMYKDKNWNDRKTKRIWRKCIFFEQKSFSSLFYFNRKIPKIISDYIMDMRMLNGVCVCYLREIQNYYLRALFFFYYDL